MRVAPWWKRSLSALERAARLLKKVQPGPAAAKGQQPTRDVVAGSLLAVLTPNPTPASCVTRGVSAV